MTEFTISELPSPEEIAGYHQAAIYADVAQTALGKVNEGFDKHERLALLRGEYGAVLDRIEDMTSLDKLEMAEREAAAQELNYVVGEQLLYRTTIFILENTASVEAELQARTEDRIYHGVVDYEGHKDRAAEFWVDDAHLLLMTGVVEDAAALAAEINHKRESLKAAKERSG